MNHGVVFLDRRAADKPADAAADPVCPVPTWVAQELTSPRRLAFTGV